jgi:opacity protein-like surface antigen
MKTVLSLVAAALLVAAAIAAQAPAPAQQAPAAGVWRSFEGTLSASGQRQTLPTESGRPAVTVQLSGPVAITAGEGLSRAFRSEVIGFDDGAGLTVLCGVWTDDRGDRIFTRLKGETVASGRRIAAAITGGTGRYAGITGEYSFEWQYVVEAEAGTISGRAIGLRGRYRIEGAGK